MSDTKRVLLIEHPKSGREDRGSVHLRSRGHRADWVHPAAGEALPELDDYDAMIVFGGTEMLSTDLDKPEFPHLRREVDYVARWIAAEKPFLGICLGSQIMARALGAKVGPRPDEQYELGFVRIEPTPEGEGFLPGPMHMYHWHREGFEIPEGARRLAGSETFPNQAMRYGKRAYGIQFHPEVAPQTFARWLRNNPDFITHPGAQPYEKQVADGERYDPAMNAWYQDFLDRWIES